MDKKLEQAYLFDFYGELLNPHQRQIYEDFVLNDLSLGEIAEEEGISRQAVADMVRRCEKKLVEFESRLSLVKKFQSIRKDVEEIRNLTDHLSGIGFENQSCGLTETGPAGSRSEAAEGKAQEKALRLIHEEEALRLIHEIEKLSDRILEDL